MGSHEFILSVQENENEIVGTKKTRCKGGRAKTKELLLGAPEDK